MQKLGITWLGHSTFLVRTPGGKRLLFDPWLTENPACPPAFKKPPKSTETTTITSTAPMNSKIVCIKSVMTTARRPPIEA